MSEQPHDRFFKVLFSNKRMAIEYFQQFLPAELVEILTWEKLKITKDSYVNQELKGQFSDIVYSCPVKGKGELIQVSLLLEHKSKKEEYPHLRLLRYLLSGWELQLQQKKPLRPIIPIIFYHGENPWDFKPFKDYFPYINSIVESYIPQFNYHLTDLTQFTDESIFNLRANFLINALITFKHAREVNYLSRFVDLILNLKEDPNPVLRDAFFVYFIRISKLSKSEMEQAREKLSGTSKQAFTSTYDMIINEGIKKGLQRGIEQGLEQGLDQAIEGLLKEGMSVELIAKALDVTMDRVLQIKKEITP